MRGYSKKLVLKFRRWQNEADLDGESPKAAAKAVRIRAWHATYNAVITSTLHNSDVGSINYRDSTKAAARIADKTHGPILKYEIKVYDDGTHELAALNTPGWNAP